MRLQILVVLSLTAWGSAAGAADEKGQFAIKGVGLATCERFVEARKAQSREYFQFGGWINGYLSSTNRYERETFDLAPWQSTGLLAGWIARFCQRNPEVPFVRAMAALVNNLGKERLATRSETVEARVGDATIQIYETTLRRVQERLSQRGYYEGETSGEFDHQTQEALERFQREAGLQPTGLPDQASLSRLLY